jgi:hypothetical protein
MGIGIGVGVGGAILVAAIVTGLYFKFRTPKVDVDPKKELPQEDEPSNPMHQLSPHGSVRIQPSQSV